MSPEAPLHSRVQGSKMTNWIHRDGELRQILARNDDPDNETESVANTKKELIPHLKTAEWFNHLSPSVIQKMEKSTTFHTFNQALELVFDYADDNKIWIEL